MKEINETTYGHYAGDDYATFFSSEKRMINKINKLKEKFPDEVKISDVNPDGSLVCDIPWSWLKISPKAKRIMTDEQKEESRERAKAMREKKPKG